MLFENFVGPTYPSRSSNISAQRTINLCPERVEVPSGKDQFAYHSTPGFSVFADLSSYAWGNKLFAVRDVNPANDRLFCLAGANLLEISSSGVVTNRGSISAGLFTGQCASNGIELFLSNDGVSGYTFNLATDTLSSAIAGVVAGYIAFLDGFFIAGKPGTGEFYISSSYDGSVWDSLDFATAESNPDDLIGLFSDHGDLMLPGLETIEVWKNVGAIDVPFERTTVIEYGVVPSSFAAQDNSIFFTGRDSRGSAGVFRLDGYNPLRISNHAIEELIASVGPLSECRGHAYTSRGHAYYMISQVVPVSGSPLAVSLVYDASTNLWHERGSWNGSTSDTIASAYVAYPITSYVQAFGKHFVTVKSSDAGHKKIFEMSDDTFTDALNVAGANSGNLIQRLRRAPHLVNEQKRIFHREFSLDAAAGPTFNLKWSNDGGTTWGSNRTMTTRNRLAALGSGRDRVYQTSTTYSAGKVAISAAYLDVAAGRS